jgi:hypothetical protein
VGGSDPRFGRTARRARGGTVQLARHRATQPGQPSKEIQFGNRVARLTHGLHFVVDTRADGNGPLRSPHPVTQGVEQLCNPRGRGLGPKPGASNGESYGMYSPYLDGFVWVTTPGESAASSCPGRPQHYAPSGIFDEGIAIGYASRANDRVGPSPRFKSRPW